MTISILRHFVLVFFVPVVGLTLAWFGPALASEIGIPIADMYLNFSVVLLIVLLAIAAWLSGTLAHLCVLASAALAVAASVPTYVVVSPADFAGLANLFDLACALLLFVALATLGISERASRPQQTIPVDKISQTRSGRTIKDLLTDMAIRK